MDDYTRMRKAQLPQQEGSVRDNLSSLPSKLSDVIDSNDLQAADAWVKTRSEDSVTADVLAEFESVTNDAMNDRSPESTRRLFRLRMIMERFLFRGHNGARGSDGEAKSGSLVSALPRDTSMESCFVQILRVLEEEAVGPKFKEVRQPQAVFARVYNFRGCRLAEFGHHVDAIDHFTIALGLESTFVPAYCNRVRCWIERGEIARAAEDCSRLTELDPHYKPGRETVAMVEALGRLQAEHGGTLIELAHAHGILELLRHYDRPRMPRELVETAMGKSAGSIIDGQVPDNRARTPREWNHEGVLAGRRGEYQAAVTAFTNAIERDPRFANAWFNRGKTFRLSHQMSEAIKDFQEAVRLDPDNDDAHVLLEEALEPAEADLQPELSVESKSSASENQSRNSAQIPVYRRLPPHSVIALKDVHSVAMSDSLVVYPAELIDVCRDMLAIGPPCSTRRYRATTPWDFATYQRRAADGLRKESRHSAARSLYRVALRILLHECPDQYVERIITLNALGLTYLALARDRLRADLIATRNASTRGQAISFGLYYDALRKGALRLASNAKACHVLALDDVTRLSYPTHQANQIANLGRVERLLGNVDTAHRYFRWALSVHEALNEPDAADIDRRQLAESGSLLTRVSCVGDST